MRSLGLLNPEKKDAEERALSKMYLNVSFLTPFSTSSMWSRNCMKRLIFQLVLQLTEFT